MAAGDMAGAAQAQLKIKQLVGERETQKAIDAIEEVVLFCEDVPGLLRIDEAEI